MTEKPRAPEPAREAEPEATSDPAAEAPRSPGALCDQQLRNALRETRWASAALLSRTLLVEIESPDPQEQPDEAFESALVAMRHCTHQLGRDACYVAVVLAAAAQELDAIAEAPPGQEAVDRLRSVVVHLHEAARAMTEDLNAMTSESPPEACHGSAEQGATRSEPTVEQPK